MLTTILLIALLTATQLHAVRLSADLTPENFENEVITDHRVWLVEFYSPMCGSCKEFTPVWKTMEDHLTSKVMTGKINIDHKEGQKIAGAVGALEDGIPALVLFASLGDSKGVSLKIAEADMTKSNILKVLKKKIRDFATEASGHYLKQGNSDL